MEGEWKRQSLSREDSGALKCGIMKERNFIRKHKTKAGSQDLMMRLMVKNGYLAGGRS